MNPDDVDMVDVIVPNRMVFFHDVEVVGGVARVILTDPTFDVLVGDRVK